MKRLIKITSGHGPKECDYAVHRIQEIFQRSAIQYGVQLESLQQEVKDNLICSVVFELEGTKVDYFIEFWSGTICWISESPFRPQHRRKNWFIAVFELQDFEQVELYDRDIMYQTMRSSGAGGQHVNKVSSAVRALHIPSGISVQVMDTRSQLQNKKLAFIRLAAKLNAQQQARSQENREAQWRQHVHIERGAAKRIFQGRAFKEK
ncbi:peptide chain release factor H [Sphingobacterium sp. LRF_L2]|uniref:peptide chain release factor H n=1 Tax=Sphingobacterium sp. LRF_L2 TaxID=3369421 RepID=UPI003F62F47D